MSSTTGSQNLLTNVFRPAYRYEIPVGGSTAMFTPSLDVSNIDVLTANSVTAFTAAIGDENENVYVGSNAGNSYSNLQGCSNNTAVGFAAASFVSNVANSVYIGYNAGAGAADSSVNIAIGANAKGNGISNIYIGSNTGSLGTGSNNILIGHNLTGSNLSNTLLIGPTPTIYGNLSTRKVGIGRDPSYNMDISGDARISYRLGVGMAPGTAENVSNVPHAIDVSGYSYFKGGFGINADPADYTFNLNGSFRAADGFGAMILQQDGIGNSVLTCKPDTTDISGRKFILNVVGDICATSIRIPGGDFSGNVTASNVIALNDVSGPTARITNIFGNTIFGTDVSGTTARFTTLFAGTFNPASVTTATVSVANGSVSTPSITFSNDVSSGFYLPSASNVAFTTAGVERMRISNTHVGIGTAVPRSALDVSTNIRAGTPGNTTNTARIEVGGGYLGDGTASTNSYPTLAFQYGDSAGGYRHFVRTRHQAATTSISNALDFFTNNSATANASTAPGTNNLLGLSITSGGVGVGMSNPTAALDVSGAIRSTAGTSNSIGGVTLNNTNLTLAGTITGSTANTSNVIGGVVLSNNNVSNSATTTSSNFVGTATASNSIGGVTLNNTNLTLAGTITGSTANTSNVIGGVTLSNSIVAAGAAVRDALVPSTYDISTGGMRASNVILNGTSGSSNGYIRNSATSWTFDISSGNIAYAGAITNSTATSSNSIGGVTLSNSIVAAGTAVRNALTPTTYDISTGGMRASNVVLNGTAGTSNGYIRNAATSWTFDISSGNFRGGAGTVSNPTYAFITDPSAGLYLPSVSNLGFTIAGRERMRIDSNGNMGLGRTDPNSLIRLDVSGRVRILADGSTSLTSWGINNNADTLVLQHTGDYNTAADVGKSASILFANATSNYPQARIASEMLGVTPGGFNSSLVFQLGNSVSLAERMRITATGNVSVNKGSVAGFPLDVSGIVQATSYFAVPSQSASNSTSNTVVQTRNSNLAVFGSYVRDTTARMDIVFDTNNNTNTVERMRIVGSNGRVGIGTSNPQSLLDVSSVTTSDGLYITAPDAQLRVRDPAQAVGNHVSVYQSSNAQGIYTASTNPFHIWTSNTIRTTILSNGNVGIGTTGPAYQLDISGAPAGILIGSTTGANGLLLQGSSSNNNGFIRQIASGGVLYLGASNVNTATITVTGLGLGIFPTYLLQLGTDSAAKPTTNTWTVSSDRRIKQNIVDADISLCYDIVKRLPLKRFTWDVSYMPNVPDRNSVGWIAQDVSDIFPNAVSRVSNSQFEDFHGLDVDQIYKSMYGAVSKLIADKEALEAKVSSMSNALESLLARVAALETTPPA